MEKELDDIYPFSHVRFYGPGSLATPSDRTFFVFFYAPADVSFDGGALDKPTHLERREKKFYLRLTAIPEDSLLRNSSV